MVRLLRVTAHLGTGCAVLVLGGYWIRNDLGWQKTIVTWWYRHCLKILNVHVEVVGADPLKSHSLVVSNHISWLDIPVLGSQWPVSFLAKSEVRRWPVVGWLAKTAGTHFIERGSGSVSQVAVQLAQSIAAGDNVLVFPEGTSTRGDSVRRFHGNLFQAAVAASAPVQPLAITYGHAYDAHRYVPFVGNDAFHSHLWRFLKVRKTYVRVSVASALSSEGRSKAELSRTARECISEMHSSGGIHVGSDV